LDVFSALSAEVFPRLTGTVIETPGFPKEFSGVDATSEKCRYGFAAEQGWRAQWLANSAHGESRCRQKLEPDLDSYWDLRFSL
jgi:hypothetical protein